ncbi:MAG: GNAT family N-acetyltransferase [Maricaulaceae bacterium]
MDISTKLSVPSAQDFVRLRDDTTWGSITQEDAQKALDNSLLGVHLRQNRETIAMCRLVGDGVFNVYIQDVIVKPSLRGKGLGQKMLITLINHMKNSLPTTCTVGLMAAYEQDGFYTRLGFTLRPHSKAGAGMTASLEDLLS